MAFKSLSDLGLLDNLLTQGKYLDELDADLVESLGWETILEFINKYHTRFPHLAENKTGKMPDCIIFCTEPEKRTRTK